MCMIKFCAKQTSNYKILPISEKMKQPECRKLSMGVRSGFSGGLQLRILGSEVKFCFSKNFSLLEWEFKSTGLPFFR